LAVYRNFSLAIVFETENSSSWGNLPQDQLGC